MNVNTQYIYQAAATAAFALKTDIKLSEDVLSVLSTDYGLAQEALISYGATLYLRQLKQKGQTKNLVGTKIILYKSPFPSEQQAKLSYEYLLSEFKDYLVKKACAVITSESDAHLALWLPQGAELNLEELWQNFITEMTSFTGFRKGFGLVMNASKLSDQGFSTLETPLVSESQPQAIAAFYIANLLYVQKRITRRESNIQQTQNELSTVTEEKEKNRLEKQLQKDQDMQLKETTKYRAEFEKMFGRLLQNELAYHNEIEAVDEQLADADEKTKKKLLKQRTKLLASIRFDPLIAKSLNEFYIADAFAYLEILASNEPFKERWAIALSNAKRYTETAANQLSTQKGDIYAKIIWEVCGLLYGQNTIIHLPPLLSKAAQSLNMRRAGDNQVECCYSCGQNLGTSGFKSRRLLFESPDQRTQSGGSSSDVKVCNTCAALSILSPVKFAPDTLVIRLDAQDKNIRNRVNNALEQQALNELGAVAGNYINLSCKEKTSDNTPVSQKLGLKQYAIAKLASIFPKEVLQHVKPTLYVGGQEISISPATLVGTSILMTAFRQQIKVANEANMKLGETIRLLDKGDYISATYVITRAIATQAKKDSKNPLKAYIPILDQGLKEFTEILKGENIAMSNLTGDVQALVGLLMPACRQIMAVDSKRHQEITNSKTPISDMDLKKWREREVAKLIQQVASGELTTFTYSSAKTVGGIAYLRRDEFTRFAHDQLERVIHEMVEHKVLKELDLETIFVDYKNEACIKITNDLIPAVTAFLKGKDDYQSDFSRKQLFYHTRLGLFSRFAEAI